jgi:hypothetical protein
MKKLLLFSLKVLEVFVVVNVVLLFSGEKKNLNEETFLMFF